ncbi:hypothetical protein E4T56_gene17373 [Termitomyces sp. T112]|nr:hypothetical protein E4T56_gene17373 [Termitomyces sp. T112]
MGSRPKSHFLLTSEFIVPLCLDVASSFVTDDDIRRLVFSRWQGVSNATIDKALVLYPSPDVPHSPFPTEWDRAWMMAGEIFLPADS